MPRGKKKVSQDIAAELQKRSRVQVNTITHGSATVEVDKNATQEQVAEAAKEALVCNHQNMHYTAGNLLCVLPKDHGGDHVGYVNGKPTAWSDAAGTPTRKHA